MDCIYRALFMKHLHPSWTTWATVSLQDTSACTLRKHRSCSGCWVRLLMLRDSAATLAHVFCSAKELNISTIIYQWWPGWGALDRLCHQNMNHVDAHEWNLYGPLLQTCKTLLISIFLSYLKHHYVFFYLKILVFKSFLMVQWLVNERTAPLSFT